MSTLWRDFLRDENGLILSAELVVILTIAVLGMVVGLANLQQAVLGEFFDLGLAFRSLNQSFATPSYRGCWKFWGPVSWTAGSRYIDVFDGCVGSGPNLCYAGGEIVSGSNSLPTQCNPCVDGTQLTNETSTVPSLVCPPVTPIVPLPSPVLSPSTNP